MPSRALIRSFVVLWWVLGVSLLVLSLRTLLSALHECGHGVHLALLAGIEAAAVLLFLLPRTLRLGAAVLFVAVHGPLTAEQWRRALPVSERGD